MAVYPTSPLQAIGADGAFKIGGGDFDFGQGYTENLIKNMFQVPLPGSGNAIEILTQQLSKLPLEALQYFKQLIPGTVDDDFIDIATSVATIMGNLANLPKGLLTGDFEEWIGTAFNEVSTEVKQIFEIIEGFIVTPINSSVQAFKDWFFGLTGKTANLSPTGEFDAAKLINMGNGLVPPEVVQGIQGITNMLTTLQQTYDGLASAYVNGSPMSNVSLPNLFDLAQQTAQHALDAITFGVANKRTLEVRTNKPVGRALDPTSEVTFDLNSLPHGSTLPTTTVAAGTSIMGYIRAAEAAKKGFVKFLACGSGGSGVYVNVYKVDQATGLKTLLWGSSDISSQIPNSSTPGYVKVLIPGASQPQIQASDLLMLGIASVGTATTVVIKQNPNPNDPTTVPQNFGANRNTSATGGNSPATLTDAQVTHSGVTPWIAFGISDVPVDYEPPVDRQFTTNAIATGGDFTFDLPSWVKVGDKIDGTALGGGGGGSDSLFAATGNGGYAGSWVDATWTYGTEIPVGTTQLKIRAGAGGTRGGYGGAPAGAATTISLPNGTVLLTANGGNGGTSGNSNGGNGQGAGNHEYNGKTRFGGANVGNSANGTPPGGGGGGGFPYLTGGNGADGSAWLTVRQP